MKLIAQLIGEEEEPKIVESKINSVAKQRAVDALRTSEDLERRALALRAYVKSFLKRDERVEMEEEEDTRT